ncbi:MAG: nucleoside-diphosphate kinase [Vampirovibrionales bacterium]
MSFERTFVAMKPDAVQRGIIGEILSRFERKGLKLCGLKMMQVSKELAETHYVEHVGKPFFEDLVGFITAGPIVAMVWEGENAVEICRKIIGKTSPMEADPGTIRFDFAQISQRNVVHGSDSVTSAEREIGLFFDQDEVLDDWARSNESWIYPHLPFVFPPLRKKK